MSGVARLFIYLLPNGGLGCQESLVTELSNRYGCTNTDEIVANNL